MLQVALSGGMPLRPARGGPRARPAKSRPVLDLEDRCTMHGQTPKSAPVRTEGCPIDTVPSDTGYRYRIILRGECGPLLAALFGDAAIESSRGRTCIIAAVRDDSGLYGLLDRIQDLALHLVSINELGSDTEP
jgi:hypothetical protein